MLLGCASPYYTKQRTHSVQCIRFEKYRKVGGFIFSSSIIRDIFGAARNGKPLIDHSSRGKSYRNLYVHSATRFANWHLPSLMHMRAFRFLLLHSYRGTVTIDIRERRKCSTSRGGKRLLRSISHKYVLCLFSYFHHLSSHPVYIFFNFTQRLMWTWCCQTIINFLECTYYTNTGKVSDSDHLSWSNEDKNRLNENQILSTICTIYVLFFLYNFCCQILLIAKLL